MKKFKFKIHGNEYNVELKSFEDKIATIEVNGTSYEVEVEGKETTKTKTPTLVRSRVPVDRKESKIKKNVGSRATSIKAPLPGTIFKLIKKEGDEVKKGETILIMEAMKMENNVLAEKDGVIASLKVREGDSVLQNDVLAEIE